jgi:hypothetical protein
MWKERVEPEYELLARIFLARLDKHTKTLSEDGRTQYPDSKKILVTSPLKYSIFTEISDG